MTPEEKVKAHWSGQGNAMPANTLAAVRMAIDATYEHAATIAEGEPEPEGPMPDDLALCHPEDIARGTVRATRKSIAAAIRIGQIGTEGQRCRTKVGTATAPRP